MGQFTGNKKRAMTANVAWPQSPPARCARLRVAALGQDVLGSKPSAPTAFGGDASGADGVRLGLRLRVVGGAGHAQHWVTALRAIESLTCAFFSRSRSELGASINGIANHDGSWRRREETRISNSKGAHAGTKFGLSPGLEVNVAPPPHAGDARRRPSNPFAENGRNGIQTLLI